MGHIRGDNLWGRTFFYHALPPQQKSEMAPLMILPDNSEEHAGVGRRGQRQGQQCGLERGQLFDCCHSILRLQT